MKLELTCVRTGFDGVKCWVHARAGATAGGLLVMTAQRLLLAGSDIFDEPWVSVSRGGESWSEFAQDPAFAPRAAQTREFSEAAQNMLSVCDFTPALHEKSGKLLGTGAEICYDVSKSPKTIVTEHKKTAYAVFDDESGRFAPWRTLEVPDARFVRSRAGCTQRLDLPDGDVLLPVYLIEPGARVMSSAVLRCGFDGAELSVKEVGEPVRGEPDARGLYEPSIARTPSGGVVMTLRGDGHGWLAVSDDGLSFGEPELWRWDDGEILENYNTQQHFISLGGKLYLVYTRRGAGNDHVFRHRAPLFASEIDTGAMRLVRSTETVLIPQRGARLGNFGVTRISDSEAIVTAAEWMQPVGCERYGSDNAIFAVRLTAR